MSDEHDRWLKGIGVDVGYGDQSGGVKIGDKSATFTLKEEVDKTLYAKNFKVWVIPCYIKGSVKASAEGSITLGDTTGGSFTIKAGGALELGIGGTLPEITAGPYGTVELTASAGFSGSYTEKDSLDIRPFTVAITGSGKVGIKIEIKDGPKLDAFQEVFEWELFILHVGRYANGKFKSFEAKPGKDLQRLINGLSNAGQSIQNAVEAYAPQFAKDAAIEAAKWTAESENAKKIAEGVGKGLDYIKKETGIDVGDRVEKAIQSLVDEGGETSSEATARVKQEMETFSASHADFRAVMDASGLRGELKPHREPAEYNAIVDVWAAEAELTVKGQDAPGAWRGMVEELVAKARERKRKKEAEVAANKKQALDADAAALAELIANALAQMQEAQKAASMLGNPLFNKLAAKPNAKVQLILLKGQKPFFAAEDMRKQVTTLYGEAKAIRAKEAAALYYQARAIFDTGLKQL